MSDDMWRERRDRDDFSEYGSLFDDAEPTDDLEQVQRRHSGEISFGDSPTGSLPHWTEPPTGEVPRLDVGGGDEYGDDEELDVWSSFSSEAPVWKDDEEAEATDQIAFDQPETRTSGQHRRITEPVARTTGQVARTTGQHRRVAPEPDAGPREPSRITIGTDPSGIPRRAPAPAGRRRSGNVPPHQVGGGAARSRTAPPAKSGRDMPAAIAVGMLLAAVFIGALMYRPWAAAAIVTLVLGLAAVEFYDKVAEKGYRPAAVTGIVTCVAAPVAAYWLGEGTLPLALAFGFMATAGSFVGARSVEAGPMPNISITTLGIVWIGLLGSFAMLILRFSTQASSILPEAANQGTDTLFLLALGVVANDVGALFVGSAAGRTPLRPWISPNKTVEGFVGGALMTIIALVVVGIGGWSDTWVSQWHLFWLAVTISVMAPLGDLVESMFKRNLDVKDFGSIIKGHGGVLDRFDGFLFTLPAVYYLTLVLEPWTVVRT